MHLLSLLPFLSLVSFVTAQQSPIQVDCDDSLADYVNALLTVLNNGGYTKFEAAVAATSETQAGYDVLDALSVATSKGTEYIFVPTDAAFAKAGVDPTTLSGLQLYDLVSYHLLSTNGTSLSSDLSAGSSEHVLFSSYLQGETTPDMLVMDKSGDVLTVDGSAKVTLGGVNLGNQATTLGGLKMYEVDTVITPPQSLSATLSALSTSSSYNSSLALYTSALTRTSMLNVLIALPGGNTTAVNTTAVSSAGNALTIFAPSNNAFSGSMTSSSSSDWTKVLNGLYSTKQTLYSTSFASAGSLSMESGSTIVLVTNSSGNYIVGSGGSTNSAKIIRSDILLDGGGVMHIVDRIISANILTTTNGTSGSTTSAALPQIGGSLSVSLIAGIVSLFAGVIML